MSLVDLSSDNFSNKNMNPVGSEYAATYGHNFDLKIQKEVNRRLFDGRPYQFMDLHLLNRLKYETVNSDEHFYQEMGWQREAIIATGAAAAVNAPTTQTFTVASINTVHTDVLITYPNGQKGNIVDVDSSAGTITVAPFNNSSLPAVSANDIFGNHSSVDHAGSEGFAVHQRSNIIERSMYVQLFNRAIRYDEVELNKLRKTGTTDNFISMEMEELFNQHRIDISNALWMGIQGEVPTSKGKPAKTTKGLFTSMIESGSPNAIGVSNANLVSAFEDVVFQSEYGKFGKVRFAFMTPEKHRQLSLAYKGELTQYAPNDTFSLLNLQQINLGSSIIVPVSYSRFKESSFGEAFQNRIIIVDMDNITPCQMWGERSGSTPDLDSDGTPKRYKDFYVDCNIGFKINNPLANAYVETV
jgi:hypothetical protein